MSRSRAVRTGSARRPSTRVRPLGACLAAVLVLVACDGGIDHGIDAGPVAGGTAGTDIAGDAVVLDDMPSAPPSLVSSPVADGPSEAAAALRRLESRLATDVVDSLDHESWVCTGATSSIEYRLVVDEAGRRFGTELDGEGRVTAVTFGWAAIGEDTVLLDYPDVGRQVELGSILFADDDALRTNDGENGPLECRRQRYVRGEPVRDVSVVAAGDVDRDVEAAAALAERIETRRGDDALFDHWLCEIAGGSMTGYVFAGADVLGPEPYAVSFDAPADAPGARDDADVEPGSRRPVDAATLAGGRAFRWLATDGVTLVLVPLGADVASSGAGLETSSLDSIVFPVEDAFTARRTDGALLQCLRDGGD